MRVCKRAVSFHHKVEVVATPNVTCLNSNHASQPAPSWNQIQIRVKANFSTKLASIQSITALTNLVKMTLNLLRLKSSVSQKPISQWANHLPITPQPMFWATPWKKENSITKRPGYQPNTKIRELITSTTLALRNKLITANLDPKPIKDLLTKLRLTIKQIFWKIIITSWVKTNQDLGIGPALVSVRIVNLLDQCNQLLGTLFAPIMNSVRTMRTRQVITKWDSNNSQREIQVTPLCSKKQMKSNKRCKPTQLL